MFAKYFLYHALFPLTVPIVLWVEGRAMAQRMAFLLSSPSSFWNQWGIQTLVAVVTAMLACELTEVVV